MRAANYTATAMTDFVNIATYTLLPEAQIALGRLEAEGVPAFLANAYLAQAIPGTVVRISLMVSPDNESAARRILDTDYSQDLEDDDETT